MSKKTTRRPGRPEKQELGDDRRHRLITIAAELFGKRGYDGVSLREICQQADMTPAMVSYYFKGKRGLIHAVMEYGLGSLLEGVQNAARQDNDESIAESFIQNYIRVVNQIPWLPQIMVREVLSKDSDLRELFMEKFANHVVEILPPRIAGDIKDGLLRPDLDPRYTLISILGMCVMPYLAEPVLGPLLGYKVNKNFGPAYSEHVKTLFMHGAGVKPE